MKEVFSINNKVFVQLIVPEIDQSYDVYLPINKKIGNIILGISDFKDKEYSAILNPRILC